ncbi:MAG: hypothetical protein ACI4TK_16755 [Agathobacter sp.]
MNGIYNFKGYSVPYLDTEMLIERKAKKSQRKLIILSCVAAILMAALAVLMLWNAKMVSIELFFIAYMVFATYIVVGVAVFGILMKKAKGDKVCLA